MNSARQSLQAEERAQVYWLLSTLCLEAPSMEFLAELTTTEPDRDSSCESLLTLDIIEALKREDGLSTLQQQLAQEFVKLFRGLREGEGPPPPYESIYIGAPDPLAAIASVADFYRQAGLSPMPGVDDQPDHLGAELRFLALLAKAEAEALNTGEQSDSDQYRMFRRSFLDRHIGTWVAEYCQALCEATEQPFYRNLTDTITKMISIDRAAIS